MIEVETIAEKIESIVTFVWFPQLPRPSGPLLFTGCSFRLTSLIAKLPKHARTLSLEYDARMSSPRRVLSPPTTHKIVVVDDGLPPETFLRPFTVFRPDRVVFLVAKPTNHWL